MKFQKKILLVYSIFATAFILVFASFYFVLKFKSQTQKKEDEMQLVSNVKVQQIDHMFKSMSLVTPYLLSDVDVLRAITSLANQKVDAEVMKEKETDFYFTEEASLIRSKLKTYYMLGQFYKIIIFNSNDMVVSNSPKQNIQTDFSFKGYPWLQKIQGISGDDVIVKLHQDDWDKANDTKVVSLIREIQDENKSYIEVQIDEKRLKLELENGDEENGFAIVENTGELIYSTQNIPDLKSYDIQKNYSEDGLKIFVNSDGKKLAIKEQKSTNFDYTLLTINETDVFKSVLLDILPLTILLVILLFAASFIYIFLASSQLTKPIKQLQKIMQNTDLSNIRDNIIEPTASDEIESLYISYKDVLKRLNQSVTKEKKLSVLQLQAQFDLLQSQVNPHFIYNVLNVISERGLSLDDEIICDVCSDLSEMLRYSTSTKQKYTNVEKEIEYLKLYLNLLKLRYQKQLTYSINVSEDIYNVTLPKIVLQQLVENTVTHGYEKSGEVIEVDVKGCKKEKTIYLIVEDKGSGISETEKAKLYYDMKKVAEKLSDDRSNVELEIGGMGIVNTYARLYLLYGEHLKFLLLNGEEKGTKIVIQIEEV